MRPSTPHLAPQVFTMRFNPEGDVIASGSHDKHIFLWRTYGECENYMMLKGKWGRAAVVVVVMRVCLGARWPTDWQTWQAGWPPHLHAAAAAPVAFLSHLQMLWRLLPRAPASFHQLSWTPAAPASSAPAGHKNAVLEVHWTPDGERLISCSPDKTVRCWDAETGGQLKKMNEHKDIVNSCCPLRRGPPLVVSGGDDCAAKLWDLRAKRSVKTFNERYQVGAA